METDDLQGNKIGSMIKPECKNYFLSMIVCFEHIMDLTTNGIVINDAIKFVQQAAF